MKTTNRLFILMAFLILSISGKSYAQETHTITLFVNTGTVDRDNTDETCNFDKKLALKIEIILLR